MLYASGEYPEVGDIVTKRGHKPTRPATVLKVVDGAVAFVTVRWGNSKGTMDYGAEELVLVHPGDAALREARDAARERVIE